jgi:hypothetical protein
MALGRPNSRLPLTLALLAGLAATAAAQVWTGVERIVAVGDLHGDYKQFVTLLRSAGLVDDKNKWKGGRTWLVQTGDVPDRGDESRRIMDLLMNLERQASRKGGGVVALIGNHEAMNLYGDLTYTTPGEFAAFRDANSERVRAHFYALHLEELKQSGTAQIPSPSYRQKWESEHPPGFFEHRFQFGPNGLYGKWIRSHHAIVKINDTIFLHGGLSPKFAAWSIEALNERVREELEDSRKLEGGLVTDELGPLWYRGLASDPDPALVPHVEAVLKRHGASRIVIGHTPTAGAVYPRFRGRVVLIDAGLSAYYGSRLACLIIEGDQAFALHRGVKLELPREPGAPLLRYLKKAASLDPQPSPLAAQITELEAALSSPAAN